MQPHELLKSFKQYSLHGSCIHRNKSQVFKLLYPFPVEDFTSHLPDLKIFDEESITPDMKVDTAESGMYPLTLAAYLGKTNHVKKLLEIKAAVDPATPGGTPINFAAADGHIDCVKELVKANANVSNQTVANKKLLVRSIFSDIFSVIHSPAQCGHTEIV